MNLRNVAPLLIESGAVDGSSWFSKTFFPTDVGGFESPPARLRRDAIVRNSLNRVQKVPIDRRFEENRMQPPDKRFKNVRRL